MGRITKSSVGYSAEPTKNRRFHTIAKVKSTTTANLKDVNKLKAAATAALPYLTGSSLPATTGTMSAADRVRRIVETRQLYNAYARAPASKKCDSDIGSRKQSLTASSQTKFSEPEITIKTKTTTPNITCTQPSTFGINTVDNDNEFRSCPNALRSILTNEGIPNPPRKNNSSLFTRRTSLFPNGILGYAQTSPRTRASAALPPPKLSDMYSLKKRKDPRLRVTFQEEESPNDEVVDEGQLLADKAVEVAASENFACQNCAEHDTQQQQQRLKLRSSGDVRDFLQDCSPSTFDRILRISQEMQKENVNPSPITSAAAAVDKEDMSRLSIIRESIESPIVAVVGKKSPPRRRSAFNNVNNDETLYIPVAACEQSVVADSSTDILIRLDNVITPKQTPLFLRSDARAAAASRLATPRYAAATPKDDELTTRTNYSQDTIVVNSTVIDDKKVQNSYPPLELSPIGILELPAPGTRLRRKRSALNQSIIADTLIEDQEVRLINERPAGRVTRRSKRGRPENPISSLLYHDDETNCFSCLFQSRRANNCASFGQPSIVVVT